MSNVFTSFFTSIRNFFSSPKIPNTPPAPKIVDGLTLTADRNAVMTVPLENLPHVSLDIDISKDPLPEIEYIKKEKHKDQIVLHHTVSATGKWLPDYWAEDKGKSRIATAYIIDKDGTVIELFNPKYWSYHLGLADRKNVPTCERTIAIEIVNEGPLAYINNHWRWYPEIVGQEILWKKKYSGSENNIIKVSDVTNREKYGLSARDTHIWRGYTAFVKYTEEQYLSLAKLLEYLTVRFNIPKEIYAKYDFNYSVLDSPGIYSHCNVRADKSDISVAFDFELLRSMFPFKNKAV